jgi:hypothetical protein
METAARETLAGIYLELGDIESALALSAHAAETARPSGEAQNVMPALTVYAAALLAAGRAGEASAVATEILGHMPSDTHGPWLVQLAATLRAIGREGDFAAASGTSAERSVWGAAALKLVRGDPAAARAMLAAAGADGVAALCVDAPPATFEQTGAG